MEDSPAGGSYVLENRGFGPFAIGATQPKLNRVKAPEIHLDLEALKSNFEWLALSARNSGTRIPLMPVVKADAYGHGAVLIAKALETAFDKTQLPYFCVARWSEAVELRAAGVKRPLLLLSQYLAEEILASPLSQISLLVATEQDLNGLERMPPSARALLTGVHVHFNTGMNRLGFSSSLGAVEIEKVLSRVKSLGLVVEGFSTHLARAEDDPAVLTDKQRSRFEGALATARSVWRAEWGAFPRWIHVANSAGLLRDMGTQMTAARPGLFLWGVHQDLESKARLEAEFGQIKLRPVLGLRCALRDVFEVEAGEGVSYGHRWVAPSRRRVGILNFGYADGLSRALSRRDGESSALSFWIEGHPAPIIGTVTMDMVLVDLSENPRGADIEARVRAGEETVWAEWIGPHQPVEKHASTLGTISYEILCDLSRRVKREAKGD
jgi:alanine racemase